jgi:hypothetical protein
MAGYGKGWITGDCIRSKPFFNIVSDDDWNTIFRKNNDPTIPNKPDTGDSTERNNLNQRESTPKGGGDGSPRAYVGS